MIWYELGVSIMLHHAEDKPSDFHFVFVAGPRWLECQMVLITAIMAYQ